jgi:3'-phosphoadenosine 5'-phosphosulfate sulfotransferase (PAPS reductase)/FAD synthetase
MTKDNEKKPWRDEEYLKSLYESDDSPTQKEIAEKLGVSRRTIIRNLPDDAQRGGSGLPYEDIAMFSGGYDSLVATHYTMQKLGGDCVLHIDTKTGLDKNKQFVENVCENFGWELEVISPDKTLTEFAKEWGFPKAHSHSWIYRYLKENPLSKFVTSLESDKPRMYTGVRKSESDRRMKNVTAGSEENSNGRWIWESPIADFSADDVREYMIKNGLPRSPVVENIGRSGECFCGAYSDRFAELVSLKEEYPEQYDWVKDVEKEVQEEIGSDESYCYWGTSGLSSDELTEVMENHSDEQDMTMCADCSGGGHRSLGYDTDPTYESIYLATMQSSSDDAEDWKNRVKKFDKTVNWIDTNASLEYDSERAEMLADAVLIHTSDSHKLSDECATHLSKLPVIIHNESTDELSESMRNVSVETHNTFVDSVTATLRHSRFIKKKESGTDIFVK